VKPHLAYRATVALIPLGVLLAVAAALMSNWLGVASGVVILVTGVLHVLVARRRGIGWQGPRTFRELRAMEAKRREQT
jgi:hypothetical protein